ncbi:MAG TPA: twin-arginine translocase TatA/TatE family subunit [Chloroflexota bacterium]|nr:twin-arginine translocase TatA/TatE family subunit [Chloroflexota bacterium]
MIGFGHFPELVMVLIIALIIFGPKRLPEVGEGLGKSLREFRKATSGVQDIARETIAPLPPPRQHVVPDLAAQRTLAMEDVGLPVMSAQEPSRR